MEGDLSSLWGRWSRSPHRGLTTGALAVTEHANLRTAVGADRVVLATRTVDVLTAGDASLLGDAGVDRKVLGVRVLAHTSIMGHGRGVCQYFQCLHFR